MTSQLSGMASIVLGIAMLGMFACLFGGVWLIVKRRERQKGVLMLVMAAVLLGNVLVWTL